MQSHDPSLRSIGTSLPERLEATELPCQSMDKVCPYPDVRQKRRRGAAFNDEAAKNRGAGTSRCVGGDRRRERVEGRSKLDRFRRSGNYQGDFEDELERPHLGRGDVDGRLRLMRNLADPAGPAMVSAGLALL